MRLRKTGFKKLCAIGWSGVFLILHLGLLPGGAFAATVKEVLAAGAGTTVTDAGRNGLTSFGVNFADTEGLWLLMDPSSSTANEDFAIQMSNYSGEPITDLWFEVRKLQGDFGYRPTIDDWQNSIKVVNGGTGGTIASGDLVDGVGFQRFHMVLNTPVSLAAGSALSISLTTDSPGNPLGDWLNFNVPQERWWLNIDWNEVDDNAPPQPGGCLSVEVIIDDQIYPAGAETTTVCSDTRITAGGTQVVVSKDAKVIYQAPVIVLNPGFRVEAGGMFQAMTL